MTSIVKTPSVQVWTLISDSSDLVAEAVTAPPVGRTSFPFNTAADSRGHLSLQNKKKKKNNEQEQFWQMGFILHKTHTMTVW